MSNTANQSSQRDAPSFLTLFGHTDAITTMAFLPDGRRLMTGSCDKTIRIRNIVDGRQEGNEIVHARNVYRLAVTNNGEQIISGDQCGRITVWDTETHKLLHEWQHPGIFPKLAISADDRLVAYGKSPVVIRELNDGQIKHEIDLSAVFALCFSPNGFKLACGSVDDILVHDVDTGECISTLKGHSNPVNALLWSYDGTRLYSASGDKTVRCWDTGTEKQIGESWTGHISDVTSLSLSPDGTKIASGSDDKTVRLWDTSGHPVGHRLGHEDRVYAVSIAVVATVGLDGNVLLWRVPWSK